MSKSGNEISQAIITTQSTMNIPLLLTLEEYSKIVRRSRATVYEEAKHGLIPGLIRFGERGYRVSALALKEFIESPIEAVKVSNDK